MGGIVEDSKNGKQTLNLGSAEYGVAARYSSIPVTCAWAGQYDSDNWYYSTERGMSASLDPPVSPNIIVWNRAHSEEPEGRVATTRAISIRKPWGEETQNKHNYVS